MTTPRQDDRRQLAAEYAHLPRWYVGIDDTDNLESRGTGFRARQLGALLFTHGLALVEGITRHQLLVSPEIPYTSHNSSACLALRAAPENMAPIAACCRDYLINESAPGADAGLCVAAATAVDASVQAFGVRAQREVLKREEAVALAAARGLILEGLTGTHGGVIGALAATGLRERGEGGRFLWVAGLRECSGRRLRLADLFAETGVDRVQRVDGSAVEDDELRIDLGIWARPVLAGGQAVLLVEETKGDADCEYRVVSKDIIKRY